jgi:hypothetical protein
MTDWVRRAGVLACGVGFCVSAFGRAAVSAQQPPLPSGREIIQRHIAAIGGEAAFKSVQSMRVQGRFEISGQNIFANFEELSARPSKMIMRAEIPGLGHTEQGFDGTVAWTIDPQTGPRVLKNRERDEAAADADFDGPLHLPEHIKELRTLDRTTFDGHPAYRVHVVLASGVQQDEFFDVQSALELGFEAERATALGLVKMTALMQDYKKFGALLQPTTLIQRELSMEQVLHITSIEYNGVPANAFDPPAQVRALAK